MRFLEFFATLALFSENHHSSGCINQFPFFFFLHYQQAKWKFNLRPFFTWIFFFCSSSSQTELESPELLLASLAVYTVCHHHPMTQRARKCLSWGPFMLLLCLHSLFVVPYFFSFHDENVPQRESKTLKMHPL